jgi:hypothetical protein
LLLHDGAGGFDNIWESAGVGDGGMGWGTNFLDFDKDGRVDIYAANDYDFSPFPNVLYRNNGDLTFSQAQAGEAVSNQHATYGTATLDYDLDGNLDLLVANRDEGLQLFRNPDNPHHWIGLKLIGVESNRDAVGARVRLLDEQGVIHYDERTAGSSWTSQSSSLVFFGLGEAASLEEATVFWPSGLEQSLTDLAPGQYYTIREGEAPVAGIFPGPPTGVAGPYREDPAVQLYPNPSAGPVMLAVTAGSDFVPEHIRVYDELGRLLLEEAVAPPFTSPHALAIPAAQLRGGQYVVVHLRGQEQTVVRRLILSR